MEYVYAAMLLHKLGKPINEENMAKVFEAVGSNPDAARVKALVASLAEVNIDEAIKATPAFMPAPAAAAAPAPAPEKKPAEEKKEEKKKEEEALEGLGALFG